MIQTAAGKEDWLVGVSCQQLRLSHREKEKKKKIMFNDVDLEYHQIRIVLLTTWQGRKSADCELWVIGMFSQSALSTLLSAIQVLCQSVVSVTGFLCQFVVSASQVCVTMAPAVCVFTLDQHLLTFSTFHQQDAGIHCLCSYDSGQRPVDLPLFADQSVCKHLRYVFRGISILMLSLSLSC